MAKFLLEIITEEVPASYVPVSIRALEETITKKLAELGLEHGTVASFATPRRIALKVDGLPEKQETRTKKISGPPKKSAVAPDGSFTGVAVGFAKKYGKAAEDLQLESTPKGEYFYLMVEETGKDTARLFEEILPQSILAIPFPKTMRWGNGEMRFARPLRSILAILGDATLAFSMDGLHAGNTTMGHRFLSHGKITVSSPDDYENLLEKAGVTAAPEKRKQSILRQFDELEKRHECRAIRDEGLVEEVCYLTESPVAVLGSFKASHLILPRELLITVMKHHQRYFPVEDTSGKLTARFVSFSNTNCEDISIVRKGYERVLEARLSDARFFYDEDMKHPLEHFAQKLSGITYMKGLGTVADKVKRLVEIATKLASTICHEQKAEVIEAAKLCKADLSTQMIFEFPELQGIMGREYAKAQGVNGTVAEAMDQHYRPRFSGDALPETPVAACVALADKIDTICGCFAIGLIPSGSEDPFSLRRHALGVIRILIENTCKADISYTEVIQLGIGSLPPERLTNKQKLTNDIEDFFEERIKNEFKTNRGISFDVVEAVLGPSRGHENISLYLPDLLSRCEALADMKKQPYAESLSTTFKRAANIVKGQPHFTFSEANLKEQVEIDLYDAFLATDKKVKPMKEAKDYLGALKEIAGIRSAVDKFFDGVMVMDSDPVKMETRVELLRRVTGLFADLADFSKLVF